MKGYFKLQGLSVLVFVVIVTGAISINMAIKESNPKNDSLSMEDITVEDNISQEVLNNQTKDIVDVDEEAIKEENTDKVEADKEDKADKVEADKEDEAGKEEQPKEDRQDLEDIHIGVGPNGEADKFDARIVWDKFRGKEYARPDQKIAFLTFDDGPSSNVTPQILDILKKNGIKATFFIAGKNLESEESKALLRRIYEEGNAIGNHTYSHDYGRLYPKRVLDSEFFIEDINRNEEVIREALGVNFKTRVVRCPGGAGSWEGMEPLYEYFYDNGMSAVDWNALTGDAEGKEKTPKELLEMAKATMQNSDLQVILMHDTDKKQNTADMLQSLIDELRARGYIFKTLA